MRRVRSIHRRLTVGAVAASLALAVLPFSAGAAGAAAPTPLGVNLLRNPGAEEGAGTDGYDTVPIPGWVVNGAPDFTVVRYGAPEFPTKAESARIGGGKKFFSCGPNNAYDLVRQTIAIKGRGGPIDAGLIRARLRVRQAGYANGSDAANTILLFQRAGGESIASLGTIPTAGTDGVFQLQKLTEVLPAGTRKITVFLAGERKNDGGSYCDAYFDNVSLKLELVN